jgi:peroxiredoxin Q/BCP
VAKLSAGDIAPDFSLTDADGKQVCLPDFAGQKVILYFYPAAMTPGCTREAVDFSAAFNSLANAGYTVVGISPDTPEKLIRFRERDNIGFALLSDVDKVALSAYGAYGKKVLYGKTFEGVIRSTFVIGFNDQGIPHIRLAQYNVRATGHVQRLCRELGVFE